MSNYTLLIAWSVAGCSLAAVLLIYWRYRRMVRHYNNYIMKYIREHDLLAKELEYAHIERDTMEKLLKTCFAEAAAEESDTPPSDKERRSNNRMLSAYSYYLPYGG